MKLRQFILLFCAQLLLCLFFIGGSGVVVVGVVVVGDVAVVVVGVVAVC